MKWYKVGEGLHHVMKVFFLKVTGEKPKQPCQEKRNEKEKQQMKEKK